MSPKDYRADGQPVVDTFKALGLASNERTSAAGHVRPLHPAHSFCTDLLFRGLWKRIIALQHTRMRA